MGGWNAAALSNADNVECAGEAGREGFDACADVTLLIDGLGSVGPEDWTGEADLISNTPPPEVTSGLSAVVLRQKDHFDLASSGC